MLSASHSFHSFTFFRLVIRFVHNIKGANEQWWKDNVICFGMMVLRKWEKRAASLLIEKSHETGSSSGLSRRDSRKSVKRLFSVSNNV
jgi:hypothetical protein